MWKSSLASPGTVGVNTTSSLILSEGPISPSLTWAGGGGQTEQANIWFLNILLYSSVSLRNILQALSKTNVKPPVNIKNEDEAIISDYELYIFSQSYELSLFEGDLMHTRQSLV